MTSQQGQSPATSFNGPPYAPIFWPLGGAPVKHVDIPAQTVFMIFFLIGAAIHMKIFRANQARGHKFLASLFIFIFCMSRVLTSILRLASVSNPRNIPLALVAQIFVAMGVIILFVINLIFSMRLVRSTHSMFGWHPAFSISFKALFALIGFTIISLIGTTIDSFYTLDMQKIATDRSFQRYGSTIFAMVTTFPIIITALACLIPYSPLDQFGTGRFRTKIIVLLVSSFFLSLGAWYRCGVAWQTPVPRTEPLPGYLAKGPFYIFNFLVEIQTVLMYAFLRVDQRWHVPDGARGPGSYSRTEPLFDVEMQNSRPPSLKSGASSSKFAVSEFENDDEDERFSLNSPFSLHHEKSEYVPSPRGEGNNSQINIVLCSPNGHGPSTSPPSLKVPEVTLSRPQSTRTSVISNRLTRVFSRSSSTLVTQDQRRNWRVSEEARIVRRLGGPWERLPSPTESTFSASQTRRPRTGHSSLRDVTEARDESASAMQSPRIHDASGRSGAGGGESSTMPQVPRSVLRSDTVPSIPDLPVNDGSWSPSFDWDFVSPKRWVSLKKRSMIGLK